MTMITFRHSKADILNDLDAVRKDLNDAEWILHQLDSDFADDVRKHFGAQAQWHDIPEIKKDISDALKKTAALCERLKR